MINKILPGVLAVVLIGTITWMVNSGKEESSDVVNKDKIVATIHKSPYCGCCGKYGEYVEDLNYSVDVVLEDDMDIVKKEFSVPYELESCHTMEVGGYIVEGHIPNEAVEKLLSEKPDIKGIGMSGMPSGSPGMPGPKEEFLIYEINNDGTKGGLYIEL